MRCSWLSVVDRWPIIHLRSECECSVVCMAEIDTFFVHHLALDLQHQLCSTAIQCCSCCTTCRCHVVFLLVVGCGPPHITFTWLAACKCSIVCIAKMDSTSFSGVCTWHFKFCFLHLLMFIAVPHMVDLFICLACRLWSHGPYFMALQGVSVKQCAWPRFPHSLCMVWALANRRSCSTTACLLLCCTTFG